MRHFFYLFASARVSFAESLGCFSCPPSYLHFPPLSPAFSFKLALSTSSLEQGSGIAT